mmetsp:Transcript_5387/g.19446  ORF Transcript_5387/g.19446 Transcript_5387/m.19446 type:complete len:311 (-) Transcript_5387:478-1410(-)
MRACRLSHSKTSCRTSRRCTLRSRTARFESRGGGRESSRRPRSSGATRSFRFCAMNAISSPSRCVMHSRSAMAASAASASSFGRFPRSFSSMFLTRSSCSSCDSSSAHPRRRSSPPNVGASRTLPTPMRRSKIHFASAAASSFLNGVTLASSCMRSGQSVSRISSSFAVSICSRTTDGSNACSQDPRPGRPAAADRADVFLLRRRFFFLSGRSSASSPSSSSATPSSSSSSVSYSLSSSNPSPRSPSSSPRSLCANIAWSSPTSPKMSNASCSWSLRTPGTCDLIFFGLGPSPSSRSMKSANSSSLSSSS